MARDINPVVIVGAGPAGLVASLALTQYGVEHVVIERHSGPAHTPRAHIVNQRTVEILRHLGLESKFLQIATPNELMRNSLWLTSLNGREIVRQESWGTAYKRIGEYAASSPCSMANCPQTLLEPLLVDTLESAGSPVRFDHEFVKFEDTGDHVEVTVLDRTTQKTYTLDASFLIGADGARSRVLAQTGIEAVGPSGLYHAANLWFRADLSRFLAHRPGVLINNVMPGPRLPLRLGTLICHKPFDEFVLLFLYDPDSESLDDMDERALKARIDAVVGEPVDAEILGLAGWDVKAQIAPVYSAGRVFCMGDAVHRHPPTGGMGLNMSIADAFNLAWKLALVTKGVAGPDLLLTYSDERQPIGQAGVDRAIGALHTRFSLEDALGLSGTQSVEEGWAALDELFSDTTRGRERRARLNDALSVNERQYNAHGLELGYTYGTGALVHVDQMLQPEQVNGRPFDPVVDFDPRCRVGARVPHARVDYAGRAISSLDLIRDDRFALLTGLGGHPWVAAASSVAEAYGVGLDVHVIGSVDGVTDCYREWAERAGIEPSGAVLVRPDRHVAWMSAEFGASSEDELMRVLAEILRRPPRTSSTLASTRATPTSPLPTS